MSEFGSRIFRAVLSGRVLSLLTIIMVMTLSKQGEAQQPKRELATNSMGMQFVRIPYGSFVMGDKRIPNASPHRVDLDSFWVSIYETTNRDFEQFRKRVRPVESRGDKQPVTRVSWKEASDFCGWLSKREGKHYRLPTEAEWEYAARGGIAGADYPWGNEKWEGRARFGEVTTVDVGAYTPNAFGLFDMAGNVAEWVSDWEATGYYKRSPRKNPKGAKQGKFRILRGGSFSLLEGEVWLRQLGATKPITNLNHPDDQNWDGSGFRVVCDDRPGK